MTGHPKFYEILDELRRLHDSKNADYATKDDPLQNFTRVAEWGKRYHLITEGKEPVKVAVMYMLKQLDACLKLLMHNEKGQVEGIPERLNDVAVYSIIARILYEESK